MAIGCLSLNFFSSFASCAFSACCYLKIDSLLPVGSSVHVSVYV